MRIHNYVLVLFHMKCDMFIFTEFRLCLILAVLFLNICREGTFFLVVEHFGSDHDRALRELESRPKSLFLYLKTIMEAHTKGSLNFSCFKKGDNVNIRSGRRNRCHPNRVETYMERISEFPKLMRDNPVHVTDNIVEQYLEVKFSDCLAGGACST